MEITSQQKGKRAEFLVFGELIKRGADLYLPVVDIGIDAILRRGDGTYLEIQVKSTQATEQAGWFIVYDLDLYEEERFFIVCVDMSRQTPEIWILPSKIFKEYSYKPWKSKKGWVEYTLSINSRSRKHGNEPRRNILKEYYEAWHLLLGDTTQGVV